MGFFHFNEQKGRERRCKARRRGEGFSDYPIDFSLAEAGRQGVMMGKEGTKAERIIKKRARGVQEKKNGAAAKVPKKGA